MLLSRHENYGLDVARLLQIDVKYPQNCSVRSRKYVNGIFSLKNAIFTTANVLGNRSTSTALLIIWSHPDLSIVSRLCSEGINLKSHRLNPISLKIAHSMFVFLSNVYISTQVWFFLFYGLFHVLADVNQSLNRSWHIHAADILTPVAFPSCPQKSNP